MRPSSRASTLAPGRSVVDFGDNEDGGGSLGARLLRWLELAIGDTDFGIDVGYIYYQYPGDTVTPRATIRSSRSPASWKDPALSVYYSDDYYAETDEVLVLRR